MNQDVDRATRKVALIVAVTSSFLVPFVGSCVNIALPSVGREFNIDAILLNWITTSYYLAAAVFLIPSGRIADICGRKRVFTYGIGLFSIASLLLAISSSISMVLSLRVLQGIGGAMIYGTSLTIVVSAFPANAKGKALGVYTSASYVGNVMGPFVGGLLTQHLGWRSIFVTSALIGIGVVSLVFWKLKSEWVGAKGEPFDFVGSAIYGFAFIAVMYGLSLLPETSAAWLIAVGLLGILAFGTWENRAKSPVLNLGIFRHNIAFTLSNLSALINFSATHAVTFVLSLYLQYTKGLGPQNAGLMLLAHPITVTIMAPFAGRLSDKVEPRIIASIGMSLSFVGLLFFTSLSAETSLWSIAIGLACLGLGAALFSSPNTNAIMSSVEKKFYGVSAATLSTMRVTGNMLSMGIVMLVFATYMGRIQIVPEYYPLFLKSTRVIFIISGALCFGGIFASLSRGRLR